MPFATASTSVRILCFLGVNAPHVSSDVVRAIVTGAGVEVVRDCSLPISVATARLDKATEVASQNFLEEHVRSMAAPLNVIGKRFANLTADGQPVVVTPRVPKEAVTTLHNHLKQIDPTCTLLIMTKEHLKKIPKLVRYLDKHTTITPCRFSIQNCDKVE